MLEDILMGFIQILIYNHFDIKQNMNFCPLFDQDTSKEPISFIDSIFSQTYQHQDDFDQKKYENLHTFSEEIFFLKKENKTQGIFQSRILQDDLFSDLLSHKKNTYFQCFGHEKQLQFAGNYLYTLSTEQQSNLHSKNYQNQEILKKNQQKADPFKRMALKIKKNLNDLMQKQKNNDNQKFAISKNMPRYFMKLMMKYFEEFGCKIQISQDLKNSLKNKSGINMKKFKQILKGENSSFKRSTMAKILRATLKKQVIQKQYITDKLSYMNSIKMFCFRCSSEQLIGRLKCK